MTTREKEEFLQDGCLAAGFACFAGIVVGLLALVLLLSGCATTRPEPVAPLLGLRPTMPPADSLPDPKVRYRRPNYARSLPTPYPTIPAPESPRTPAQAGQKSGLGRLVPVWMRPKSTQLRGSGPVKDKSRVTINVYNAPAKVKNSNVATDSGTVTDNTKAAKKQDEKPNLSTHTGVPAWQLLLLGILVLALGVYGLHRLS